MQTVNGTQRITNHMIEEERTQQLGEETEGMETEKLTSRLAQKKTQQITTKVDKWEL